MPPSRKGARATPRSRLAGALAALGCVVALSGCKFIISTGPTPVSGGTIVFVVVDDGGAPIGDTHISVRDAAGEWSAAGLTATGGDYRCQVGPGIGRVTVSVEPPDGFTLADHDWPRQIDLAASGTIEVRVRLRRAR